MLLYNFAILLYGLGIRIAAMFGNVKARLWIEGRRNWWQKIKDTLKAAEKRVWFHCSSLGEFEQGRTVIEAFRKEFPKYKIVLTFFSPSGFEHRKNYPAADYIFYLPLDSRSSARDFIDLVAPEKVFFVKYDYWLNYFLELKRNNIPLYVVSGVFRPTQIFFKWYGSIFRKALKSVTQFFLQDESSAQLLQSLGVSNYSITGDTRFDRVIQIAETAKEIEKVKRFKNGKRMLVAGSTWHEDEAILIEFIKNHSLRDLKIIFVPHEINHRHIGEIEYNLVEKAGLNPDDISIYTHEKENVEPAKVLIIDTIGLLSSVYHYGEMAYIGGGFGKGIHNTLEAAVYGIPVLFGPNYKKFLEAEELVKFGGAFAIHSSEELLKKVQTLLNNPGERERVSLSAKNYVSERGGATGKIFEKIRS
jgi:3-deoxy-D-manno-octulosonic-acid transferase